MSLHAHHRHAVAVLAVTAGMVVILGTLMGWAEHCGPLHGMYCTTGFATTAGCDLAIRTPAEYVLGELSMILMVPLFGAAFSLFTSGLADVAGSEARIKDHVNGALRHHLGGTR